MTQNKLIIGSRGSKLAMWQTNHIADELRKKFGLDIEIKKITTKGDKILDSPLSRIGDKGLFVKEIETALSSGEIDLAVHSMKDVPTDRQAGLAIKAMTVRADPRDVLISRNHVSLADLPEGATIGTSSLRRQAQLLHFRSDFKMADVRGNLDTRLGKMKDGEFDAMILAAAGIDRLEYSDVITERIPAEIMVSAVGQGSIGIEVREDDAETIKYVSALSHKDTFDAITAERALLAELEGGCQVPIGALGKVEDGVLNLTGIVAALDGKRLFKDSISGAPEDAAALGRELARKLADAGGAEVLQEIRAQVDAENGFGV
jgi:hydroxymethylbilane synthase